MSAWEVEQSGWTRILYDTTEERARAAGAAQENLFPPARWGVVLVRECRTTPHRRRDDQDLAEVHGTPHAAWAAADDGEGLSP